ncbi:SDR family NAD(P)-dependent oxidoreductase [Streptomyces sp. NPDC059070]|uniref:SDR family NAD(P)-dependent oxidoreductase n=1 Tax=Streptomyces sp. NPDC059070 TaxID=3346713 RepID=UPI00368BFB1F
MSRTAMAVDGPSGYEPIAIVGMGCRFPGGVDSPAGLWRLLVEGRDTAGRVPEDRWDAGRLMAFQHPDDAPRIGWGCFLDGDIWAWDPEALSIAKLEAAVVDPQHRLMLEVVREAIEHAGVPMDRVRGTRTGVYLGYFAGDNQWRSARPVEDHPDPLFMYGNFNAAVAGRVSFGLDLRGPNMVVETFCSSSLVATHLACVALQSGDCDAALAGASQLIPAPVTQMLESSLLSRRGRCHAFDERADGYVRGEGAGVVLLKRLDDAMAAGDRVLAVIRGSAVTNDGQTQRATAPSTVAQQACFRSAVERAGVDPGDVGFVEAHGTGTEVGDPVEYTSLNAVYGRGRGRCAIGSIKTNIGHTEATAGTAGLIKAVLCVRHGTVPPNLHFRKWHPAIPVDEGSRLFVPTEKEPWPVHDGPRLAAVCSYGIGGANAHVIVEQALTTVARRKGQSRLRAPGSPEPARVFTLSAASDPALQPAAARLAEWLDTDGAGVELGDLAHTLTLRRRHAAERLGVVASSREQLVARLRAFAAGPHGEGRDSDGVVAGQTVLPPDHAGPVLVFPGLGGQWPGMGQELLATEPAFTAAVDELDAPTLEACGWSLRTLISRPGLWDEAGNIYHTMVGLQIALAAMWRSWGITPAAVIGQSLGEVPAAVVAGALSPNEAVAVTHARAVILEAAAGGGMASVLLPADQVERDIIAVGADRVSVGVYVSPRATVVSGNRVQITRLMRTWQQRGVTARWVAVNVASHSRDMDPVLEQYRQLLHEVDLAGGLPRIPFYSTVAQNPHDGARVLDTDYWVRNTRRPVRFSSACAAALADGYRLFIECSAHPLAVRAIADTAREARTRDVAAVSSLRRGAREHDTFLTNLATVHTCGHPVGWADHYGDGELVEAPTTTWNRVHHRVDPPYTLVAPKLVGASEHALLGGHVHDPAHPERHLWQTPISPDRLPWLSDHQVAGVPIMAGAGICEMMLAAAATIFETDRVQLRDLRLERPLVLDPEPLVSVVAVRDGDGARVEVLSRATGADAHQDHVRHGHATVAPLHEEPGEPDVKQWVPAADWTDIAPSDLYAYFRERHGVTHGPAFTGLERIQLEPTGARAVATLRLTDEARVSSWMMRLHPALLDELAQTGAAVWRDRHVLAPGPVVFAGIDRLTVSGPAAHARRAHVQLDAADHTSTSVSGLLSLADGHVVAQVEGLRIVNATPPEQRFASRLAHLAWVPAETPRPSTTAAALTDQGSWVVVAETTDAWAEALAGALRGAGAEAHVHKIALHADPAPHIEDLLHHGRCAGIVLALGNGDGNDPCEAARSRVGRACRIAGLLATRPHPARLWVAARTNGASLTAAGMRGVLRTATYECPQLAPSMVEAEADTPLDHLAAEILRPGPPVEVAWRGGRRHIARLRFTAPDSPTPAPPKPVARPDGAYLITGGLGGIGLVTAAWLTGHGAHSLVLVGRSAPSAQAQQTLEALREQGTQITVLQGDIGEPGAAQAAVLAAEQEGAVLRGVFHCAGVVRDATLATLAAGDLHQLAQVWRGKAHGAWALHEATLDRDLDWWVLYSSMAALVGSPGQAAHASANAWLDELAAWRAAQGLPATSIQWGGWSEVGEGQHMAERGYAMISPNDGLDALDRILAAGYTTIAYAPPDLARWTKPYPGAAETALFTDILGVGHGHDDSERLLADLRAADSHTQRRDILHEHIIAVVRDILGTTSRVTPVTSMVALGMDSLGAVQLQQRLQHALKISFETGVVWLKPTAAGITDWILHKMGYQPDSATSPPGTPG